MRLIKNKVSLGVEASVVQMRRYITEEGEYMSTSGRSQGSNAIVRSESSEGYCKRRSNKGIAYCRNKKTG